MALLNKLLSFLLTKFGVVFVLCALWQSIALLIDNPDFPSLLVVIKSLHLHLTEGEMISNLFITLKRALLSFIIAMLLGVFIGIMMGVNAWTNKLTDSLLIIMLNIPALVTILLCYIWIGLVETAAITAVVINKVPTVVIMIREGARTVDQDLLAVAKIYKLSPSKTFFRVFLPQLYPYIIASARSGLSLIWKIVLVVELLGRSDGVGFALNTLFQFFDIAGILAYTIAFVIIILIIELLFFKPFDKLVARGKRFD
ncbi:ABC transporter permease [Colwellia sp. 20A7]|uniref:ABC transporter permease n=1 Tax=Colwellia sp. 20A7 TaxID=2689569 RepID=UPI0013588423|nr:ABC transporter permease subunit [Colwellia sp. 20A7]